MRHLLPFKKPFASGSLRSAERQNMQNCEFKAPLARIAPYTEKAWLQTCTIGACKTDKDHRPTL